MNQILRTDPYPEGPDTEKTPVATSDPILVTRPSLPRREDLEPFLEEMWTSRFVTNRGPLVRRFEHELERYLGVPHVSVVANATLGCMIAMRALGLRDGEVVTTPFTFVATAHSAHWLGLDPIFADIEPTTLNLDPADVARRITPRTRAILPVHCYANPCDTAAFEAIGKRHGIPVIYDAAHCFAARDEGGSLLRHGTLSVVSFHATKVFSTFEGGAIVSHDAATKATIDRLCNFGFAEDDHVDLVGLNAKMSEMHAALGLAQLPRVAGDVERRGRVALRYRDGLADLPGLTLICPPGRPGHNNYAFPVLVGDAFPVCRDALYAHLGERGIHTRRYFRPLATEFPMYRDPAAPDRPDLPQARRAAERVLCLPLYPDLSEADQDRVIGAIRSLCG
jgi:dTDP-4-amino-4,6-dideoxygalactose transaminase